MGTAGSFPQEYSGRGIKLSTHLHLVLKLRMRGAIPQFPHTFHGVVIRRGVTLLQCPSASFYRLKWRYIWKFCWMSAGWSGSLDM